MTFDTIEVKPILFLVFNRPRETSRVFDKIRQAKPKNLYIACDGPRPERGSVEEDMVRKVREICRNVDWDCTVKYLFRESNLGCRNAVSEAISWFFDNEEMGIVLEDDCLPSSSFFQFTSYLLEYYKYDTRIMHIGGTNPLQSVTKGYEYSYYFSIYNRIWGWASWRRAWKYYDVTMASWPKVRESQILRNMLGAKSSSYFRGVFDMVHNNSIDTWDYQWFYSRLLQGLAVIPSVNLVSNIGFNDYATHTVGKSFLANLPTSSICTDLVHPPHVVPNYVFDDEWVRIMPKPKIHTFVFKLIKKCKKIIRK